MDWKLDVAVVPSATLTAPSLLRRSTGLRPRPRHASGQAAASAL